MVQLTQYIVKSSNTPTRPLPYLNSLFQQKFSLFNSFGPENAFKTYMRWARRSPQLMGFLNLIATDILSDTITWEPLTDNRTSGKNKVRRSEEFFRVNDGRNLLEETIYDMMINGLGLNWVGKLNEENVKEACKELCKTQYKGKHIETKANALFELVGRGELSTLAKKWRHIPATTIRIENDDYEITKYWQIIGVKKKSYTPDEIISYKLMPLDGKVYPFAPLEALLAEIYLMWLLVQNYVSLFENGGHPDKIFILPKEIANSKNHRFLVETLKKYKRIQNKHGNLVFTGDIKVEDLAKIESQMQHQDLGLYLVGVLALFYNVPVSRIPFIVGKAASKGDSGGLADTGYWRKISVLQSKIEEASTSCLWGPYFGTKLKFGRGYKQDEIRETQNEMNKNNVVEQRINLGLWTAETAGKYLGIDADEIRAAQEEKKARVEEVRSGLERQNMDSNDNLFMEKDKKLKNKDKQDTQKKNQQNDGGKKINL